MVVCTGSGKAGADGADGTAGGSGRGVGVTAVCWGITGGLVAVAIADIAMGTAMAGD